MHSLDLTGIAGDPGSRVHRLDPRAKILGLLGLTVVAVSTPLERWPAFVACATALAVVAAVARVRPVDIWRRIRVVLPLVLLAGVFLPIARSGGLAIFAAVAVKALIGTTSAALLAATTPFPAVLRGLEALRVPRLLILIAGFMYRYLFVIAAELSRMRWALLARGYRPRHPFHAAPAGRVATALFLRTYGRGERVYRAMLARGYRGTMPYAVPLAFRRADAVFVAAVVLAVLPLRVLGVAP
jgi:cobalt/nickel transport system permease protein